MLGEKLSRAQIGAIALAVVAVALLTRGDRRAALGIADACVTWGFYALFKKTLPIGPAQGFFLEVLILSIPALGYIVWLQARGVGHFGGTGAADMWWLLGCGIVTAVPLILFANGAKLLRLSTIGIMQYIAPTLIFFVAIFIFKEPFTVYHAVAFALIWAALVIYSWSMFAGARNRADSYIPLRPPIRRST